MSNYRYGPTAVAPRPRIAQATVPGGMGQYRAQATVPGGMGQYVAQATVPGGMGQYIAQATVPGGMGTIGQIWENYKGLILLGGVAAVGLYFLKKKGMMGNPEGSRSQANLVLRHIDDFAAEHPRGEVSRVLDNVERRFPGLSSRVDAARARVL
jgi:hypothetical protein